MTEMIDRVAKRFHDEVNRLMPATGDHPWETANEDDKATARKFARAAIAALREPTSEQDAAFAQTIGWMADTPLGNQQREAWRIENHRRWQIMIDAALGERGVETGS